MRTAIVLILVTLLAGIVASKVLTGVVEQVRAGSNSGGSEILVTN